MDDIIKSILEDAKDAYKESIITENKIIEDKLLSLMANVKYLENELKNNNIKKEKKKKTRTEIEKNEIEKVKRKVPMWLKKRHQYNYIILKTFMNLSNNNSHYVNLTTLESHSNIDNSKKFISNYNLLKSISEKNHAKIFEEKDGQIVLWQPVSEIIVKYFT